MATLITSVGGVVEIPEEVGFCCNDSDRPDIALLFSTSLSVNSLVNNNKESIEDNFPNVRRLETIDFRKMFPRIWDGCRLYGSGGNCPISYT